MDCEKIDNDHFDVSSFCQVKMDTDDHDNKALAGVKWCQGARVPRSSSQSTERSGKSTATESANPNDWQSLEFKTSTQDPQNLINERHQDSSLQSSHQSKQSPQANSLSNPSIQMSIASSSNIKNTRQNKQFQCKYCYIGFDTFVCLQNHEKQAHYDETPLKCKACDIKFTTMNRLRNHLDINHLFTTKFLCTLCSCKFKNERQLYDHKERIHTELFLHKCNKCGSRFMSSLKLMQHEVACNTMSVYYKCPYCSILSKSRTVFKTHLSRCNDIKLKNLSAKQLGKIAMDKRNIVHEGESSTVDQETKKNSKRATKNKASSHHTTSYQTQHHENKTPARECVQCSECLLYFSSKNILVKHLKNGPKCLSNFKNDNVDRLTRLFQCKYCDASFSYRIRLKNHEKFFHFDEKHKICLMCSGKKFISLDMLKEHLQNLHSFNRQHVCFICMKSFKLRKYLRHHLNHVHGSILPFLEKAKQEHYLSADTVSNSQL